MSASPPPRSLASLLPASVEARVVTTGQFFGFIADVLTALPRRPYQVREFLVQAWFIASVSVLPTALVSVPLGAVVALQVGNLSAQFGAESFTGASSVLAIVREGAPIAAALILAGAAGSAICADFGARKIREEIDAMEVLGINPVSRLVVPRVLACTLIGVLLTGFVTGVGIAGGYFFNVVLQGGTPGVYIDSFRSLATVADVVSALLKGAIFGAVAALIGSFFGLRAGGGPRGVGQAVNESVVITFLLLFVLNYLLTTAYFQLYPQVA